MKKIALFCAAPALLCAALLAGCGGSETTPVPEAQPPVSSAAEATTDETNGAASAASSLTDEITLENAKQIAADDAGAKDPVYAKAALETDDGTQIYDVELIEENTKYDYEIDAKTGAIREREKDLVVNPTMVEDIYITPDVAADAAEKAADLSGSILTKIIWSEMTVRFITKLNL